MPKTTRIPRSSKIFLTCTAWLGVASACASNGGGTLPPAGNVAASGTSAPAIAGTGSVTPTPSAGSGAAVAMLAGSSATNSAGSSAAVSGTGASAISGRGGSAGSSSTAGRAGGTGSAAGSGGSKASAGVGAGGGAGSSASAGSGGGSSTMLERFSFFVTSLEGMQRLSKSANGFGGDLRYGQADGLSGADKICTDLAEASLPGASKKGWRAFLSVAAGPDGKPVNAIDRVGAGPWYDRQGRLVAMTKTALINTRPQGADSAIVNDLPNEYGIPNHRPDATLPEVDNHHVLTGSDTSGKLYQNNVNGTCANWTSTAANAGKPQVGVSWIAGNRTHWISQFSEGGCGAKVSVVEMGGPTGEAVVGSGGGYGGIYCFALMP